MKKVYAIGLFGLLSFGLVLTNPPVSGRAGEVKKIAMDTLDLKQKTKERIEYKERIMVDLRELKPRKKEIKKVVKNKTKYVYIKQERDIYIQYGDRYFPATPYIDEEGNYVLSLDTLQQRKKEQEKALRKPNRLQRLLNIK